MMQWNQPAITIATNETMRPDPSMTVVYAVLEAGMFTPLHFMTLI